MPGALTWDPDRNGGPQTTWRGQANADAPGVTSVPGDGIPGGGAATVAPFGTTWPLDANTVMEPHTVSGPLSITPVSAAVGGQCYCRMTANGANVPYFGGVYTAGSSLGWLNTAGAINLVTMWHDGAATYLHIEQQVGAMSVLPDAVAPVLSGEITFSAIGDTSASMLIPAASDNIGVTAYEYSTNGGASYTNNGASRNVTLSGLTASTQYQIRARARDAAGNTSAVLSAVLETTAPVLSAPQVLTQPASASVTEPATATFSATFSGTPSPTIQWELSTDAGATWAAISGANSASYTTPATAVAQSGRRFRSVATNSQGVATTSAATLTVAADVSAAAPLRFTALAANVTESGDSNGYTYTAGAGANLTNSASGGASRSLPASTDGWWGGQLTVRGGTGICLLALDTTAATQAYTANEYAIYSNGTTNYRTVTNGAGNGSVNGAAIAPAVGHYLRLRRAGTSLFAEVSTDGGATYSILHTWTGVTTAALYPMLAIEASNNLANVMAQGMV